MTTTAMSPNSHGKEGAASAASSLVIPEGATVAQIDRMEQAAHDAIDNVQDPEAAQALLDQVVIAEHAVRLAKVSEEREQRWGGIRLRAERRYGELLGPATAGGHREGHVTGGHVGDSDRKIRSQARKVAAVSDTDFEKYVKSEPRPTRSGLLRKTAPPPRERKREKNTPPEKALERLRERVKQVRALDARVRPRWTLEDVADVDAALKLSAKRRKKYAGKRLREIAAKRRNGDELAALQHRILQLTAILESVDVAAYDLADAEDVSFFHDDLVALQMWMDRSIGLASSRLDDAALERKISKLREVNGRTPEEQRTALMLAERLEQRRRENRLSN